MKQYIPVIFLLFIFILRILMFPLKEIVPSTGDVCTIEFICKFRTLISQAVYRVLPSPQAELLLGMTIGIDDFSKIPAFKKLLIDTGTIHVVVVSGFNINLVSGWILRFLGSPYKLRNFVTSQILTLLYALLSGFEAPVIRAWAMSFIVLLCKYYGRSVDGLQVLLSVGLLILIINPEMLLSMSFQLSFMATLGLLVLEKPIRQLFTKILSEKFILLSDLTSTFAAQIMVFPLISHGFGRVTFLGFLVNPIILWLVPLCTVLGFLFILPTLLSSYLSAPFIFIVMPFFDLFVMGIKLFSGLSFININYKLNIWFFCLYYLVILVLLRFNKCKRNFI